MYVTLRIAVDVHAKAAMHKFVNSSSTCMLFSDSIVALTLLCLREPLSMTVSV